MIAEQQKSAKEYNIDQTVYMIVVLTAPYTINEKSGKAIKDEVLLLNINPETLTGEVRNLYGHQFVCLNPYHPDKKTPQNIRDWLDLIYQSIHSPGRPILNIENLGIKKAIELISFENLTPSERAEAKNEEARKITIVKLKRREENLKQEITKEVTKEITKEVTKEVTKEITKEVAKEFTQRCIQEGIDDLLISEVTDLDIMEVEAIRKEMDL